jgi:hypothetical protein
MIRSFDRQSDLFQIFETYRIKESLQTHDLAVNYSNKYYLLDQQVRFFIGFDKGEPKLFSSIFRLDWWPAGSFRILNRLWKPDKDEIVTKEINPLFFEMVREQVSWVSSQESFEVAFVSRQGNSKKYLEYFAEQNRIRGVSLKVFERPIKTCKGPDCDCLQNIAYIGNKNLLKMWPE